MLTCWLSSDHLLQRLSGFPHWPTLPPVNTTDSGGQGAEVAHNVHSNLLLSLCVLGTSVGQGVQKTGGQDEGSEVTWVSGIAGGIADRLPVPQEVELKFRRGGGALLSTTQHLNDWLVFNGCCMYPGMVMCNDLQLLGECGFKL